MVGFVCITNFSFSLSIVIGLFCEHYLLFQPPCNISEYESKLGWSGGKFTKNNKFKILENFLGVPLKCISHQNLHVLCGCWLCFFIGLCTCPSCFTKFANAFKLTVNILYSSYPLTLYLNLLYYHMHWLDSQVSDISFPYYMIQNVYLLGGGVPYKKEWVLLQYFLWWTMPTKLYLDTSWGFFKIPNMEMCLPGICYPQQVKQALFIPIP